MMVKIEPALLHFSVVLLRHGGQSQKPPEQQLVSGLFPLLKQRLGMIGMFKILISVITAVMTGDELVLKVNAEPVGIGFEQQSCSCVFGRDGIAVGIQDNPKLTGRSRLTDGGDIKIMMEEEDLNRILPP